MNFRGILHPIKKGNCHVLLQLPDNEVIQLNSKGKIAIPKPCSESWELMNETDGGRYCDKCAHNVVDFTKHDEQSILDTLKNAKGRVCGKFRPDQLINSTFKSKIRTLRRFCIAAILAFGLSLFNMSKSLAASLQTVADDCLTPAKVEVVSGEVIIRGKVVDKDTNEPLPFVNIYFEGPKGMVGTTTDFDGNYVLKFDAAMINESDITLIVRSIGYGDVNVEIPAKKLKPGGTYEQVIAMETQGCLGMPIIIVERDYNPHTERYNNLSFEDEEW